MNFFRSSASDYETPDTPHPTTRMWTRHGLGLACSLWLVLSACTLPGVNPPAKQAAAAASQGDAAVTSSTRPADLPDRLWTAVVTGGERWAGRYQGEQGHAVMQNGELRELELQNLAFGMGRFTTSLESPPFLFRFAPKEMLVPFAGVVLRYENPSDRDKFNASFTGQPTSVDVTVEDGRLHGQLSFDLKNGIGETVQLTVYDLNVPVR